MIDPNGTTVPANDGPEHHEDIEDLGIHPDDAETAELVIQKINRVPPVEGEESIVELDLYMSQSFLRSVAEAESLESADDVSDELACRYRDQCMLATRLGETPPFVFGVTAYPGITEPAAISILYSLSYEDSSTQCEQPSQEAHVRVIETIPAIEDAHND